MQRNRFYTGIVSEIKLFSFVVSRININMLFFYFSLSKEPFTFYEHIQVLNCFIIPRVLLQGYELRQHILFTSIFVASV